MYICAFVQLFCLYLFSHADSGAITLKILYYSSGNYYINRSFVDIYNATDSICAELSLSAISSLQGRVVTSDLKWSLTAAKTYVDDNAKALFRVPAGTYVITAIYKNKEIKVGEVKLVQSKLLSRIILLQELGGNDRDEAYFISEQDLDKVSEFTRRQQERAGLEGQFELAGGPLASPYQGDTMGQGFAQHPLLQSAAFDGLPPDMKNDPAQNETAVQKQLEHTHQLQQQLGSAPTMSTPSPTRR